MTKSLSAIPRRSNQLPTSAENLARGPFNEITDAYIYEVAPGNSQGVFYERLEPFGAFSVSVSCDYPQ